MAFRLAMMRCVPCDGSDRARRVVSRRLRNGFAGSIALSLTLAPLASCVVARQALYAPRTDAIDIAHWTNTPPQTLAVNTSDHLRLTGYYWPGAAGDRDIFLFFYGRHAHAGIGAKYAQYLRGRGDAVLVASYRGFGSNPGSPSQRGLERDATAFLVEARRLAGPGARIWLVGHSLGGAVALQAAAQDGHVAGIFALSAFVRIGDAAPPLARIFIPDPWDNVAAVKDIAAPIVFLQGAKDNVIPLGSGAALLAASTGPAVYISLDQAAHKPYMQQLGPWISAAIGTMTHGSLESLPPLPQGWTERAEHP